MFLLASLLILLGSILTVEGFLCDKCIHVESASSSSVINSRLRASGLLRTDLNCKQFNSNYVSRSRVSCSTVCYSQAGYISARLLGHSLTVITAERGCASYAQYSPQRHVAGTCEDYSQDIEDTYRRLGYSSITASAWECYCDQTSCNGRNNTHNARLQQSINHRIQTTRTFPTAWPSVTFTTRTFPTAWPSVTFTTRTFPSWSSVTFPRWTTRTFPTAWPSVTFPTRKSGDPTVSLRSFFCDSCSHMEATSSTSELNALLKSLKEVQDDNCKQFNSNYVSKRRVSCLTSCYSQSGSIHGKYMGHSFHFKTAARGCNPQKEQPGTCKDFSNEIKSFYKSLDMDIDISSVTVWECYCNQDSCNGQNMQSSVNDKMTKYFNLGSRMAEPSFIVICLIAMVGLFTTIN